MRWRSTATLYRRVTRKNEDASAQLVTVGVVIEIAVWRFEILLFGDQQKARQVIGRSGGSAGTLGDSARLSAGAGNVPCRDR